MGHNGHMLKLNQDQIARLAHESLRQARILMFDPPMAPWADAKPHHRTAMLDIVRRLTKDPSTTAKSTHEAFLAERTAQGWSYGPYHDTVNLRGPLLAPWADLSPKYRAQQNLVYATIRHLLNPEAEG